MVKGEHSLLHHIQTIFESGTVADLSDRQLMERFAGRDRETAELCFAALIKRHGPMVFRTCQAVLRDRHDAEDAFQATFLVLARKARSLWVQDSLGPWLFEVASRVAASARSAALSRRNHERRAAKMGSSIAEGVNGDDRRAVLCEELNRLPDRYRAALVLCDLEGLTQEKAAQLLGWPAGTVRSRLSRGRQRLRDRLTRRGLAPSALPALPWITGDAPLAAVPASLAEITTHAALKIVATRAVTVTTASVGSLTEGALRMMFWSKIKVITVAILAGCLVAGTAVLARWSAGQEQRRAPEPQAEARAKTGAESKSAATVRAPAGARPLSPTAKARLEVAKKMRDGISERVRIDPNAGFTEVIVWQNRYHEVIAEVLVKTDADQVQFLEHRLALLKRIENYVEEMRKNGFFGQTELFAIEMYRLEAEDRLEKATAKLAAGGAASAETVSTELVEFLKQDSWDPGAPVSRRRAP
jgi:RNA polymerase sigma factor (sigma-70 family)